MIDFARRETRIKTISEVSVIVIHAEVSFGMHRLMLQGFGRETRSICARNSSRLNFEEP